MTIPKVMHAVVKTKPGPGMTYMEVPVPEIGPSDVLIKVRAVSICGTDLHIYRWDEWAANRLHPPLTIGHELCGHIVAKGIEVHHLNIGDFVSAESHVVCGNCAYCRTGRGHLCPHTKIIGVDRDGAWAEYISLPAINAWPNPPDTPPEIASLQENFGNAVHTAFAIDLSAKKVLVTGCGPVGVMAIAVAKAVGARLIIATDISDYRLDLARKMGANDTFNAKNDGVVEKIMEITGGEGVDAWLEMSGAPAAIHQGFNALKPGGEVAMLGLTSGPVKMDVDNYIIFKGATVHGIVGRRLWQTWYQMSGLIRSGAVNLMPLVTHRFPLSHFEEAIETMASGRSGKVVMFPDAYWHNSMESE